ncbi:MAG: hypothetical protein NWF08_07395 [Candidatus Bathyarchaeota archaeon]|nr:hypothetical protein [Candidatus Bathyarchaeota archaeon]
MDRFALISLRLAIGIIILVSLVSTAIILNQQYTLQKMESKLVDLQIKEEEHMNQIETLKNELFDLRELTKQLRSKLDNVTLSNPTQEELIQFLEEDDTDTIDLNKSDFGYKDLALQLKLRAREKDINMSYCEVTYRIGSFRNKFGEHTCNSVTLEDGTQLFIDPQKDKIYEDLDSLVWDMFKSRGAVKYSEIW